LAGFECTKTNDPQEKKLINSRKIHPSVSKVWAEEGEGPLGATTGTPEAIASIAGNPLATSPMVGGCGSLEAVLISSKGKYSRSGCSIGFYFNKSNA